MAQDRPSLINIIGTVRAFLDDCTPALEGERRYHAQVASYLLGICERELTLAADFIVDEQTTLAGLVGEEGSIDQLRQRLCAEIRSGRHDHDLESLVERLLPMVENKVRIVKPAHLEQPSGDCGPD